MLDTTESPIEIAIYLDAENATARVAFVGQDLNGATVEFVLTPKYDAAEPVLLSTAVADSGLTIAVPNVVVMTYQAALAAHLPKGLLTLLDVWVRQGEVRRKIGAGHVYVARAGEFRKAGGVVVEVPGLQGFAGWAPVLATVTDGDRNVQQVSDWIGGGGVKPASGLYVGADGLVEDIDDAVTLPAGVTPNISFGAVTTLPPGQPASAVLAPGSTPAAPVIDLSLPQGAPGVISPPIITAYSPPLSQVFVDSTLEVSGTFSPRGLVQIFLGADLVATTFADANGYWSAEIDGFDQGQQALSTRGIPASAPVSFNVGPALPALAPLDATLFYRARFDVNADIAPASYAPEQGPGLIKTASPSYTGDMIVDAASKTLKPLGNGNGSALWVVNGEIQSDVQIFSGEIVLGEADTTQVCVLRCRTLETADRGGYGWAIYGNGQIRLMRYATAGQATLIASSAQTVFGTSATERVKFEYGTFLDGNGGVGFTASINGNPIVWTAADSTTFIDPASPFTRRGKAAFYIAGTAGSLAWLDIFTAPEPAGALNYTSPRNEEIIQRKANGKGDIFVVFTSNFAIGPSEIRIFNGKTKLPVPGFDWQDVQTIGRGVGSHTFADVPTTNAMYWIETRRKSDPKRIHRRRVGVGIVVLIADSQSNGLRLYSNVGNGAGSMTGMSRLLRDSTGYKSIVGVTGIRRLATEMERLYQMPIGFYGYAVTGSSVNQWLVGGDCWTALINPVNGLYQPGLRREFEKVLSDQGEKDFDDQPGEVWYGKKRTVHVQLDAINNWDGGQATKLVSTTGPVGATKPFADAIRKAQMDMPLNEVDVSFGSSHFGALVASDKIHFDPGEAGYGNLARWGAEAFGAADGLPASKGGRGPVIVSAVAGPGGAYVDVIVEHDKGTALTDSALGTTGAGLTAFIVRQGAALVAISSTAFQGGAAIRLTPAVALSPGASLSYLENEPTNYTNLVFDNVNVGGRGLPLRPSNGGPISIIF